LVQERAYKQKFEDKIKTLIENLVKRTGESAGFCLYRNKKLVILHSISCPDSINIIGPGNILHYEADHAASLAVMDLMTKEERDEALKSSYSLTTESDWLAGRKQFSKESYYADLSRLREGISRLALPWQNKTDKGSLFICLPTIRMKQREERLIEIMQEELDRFFG
jgi:DNA-binding IclR family transcriptional regulator